MDCRPKKLNNEKAKLAHDLYKDKFQGWFIILHKCEANGLIFALLGVKKRGMVTLFLNISTQKGAKKRIKIRILKFSGYTIRPNLLFLSKKLLCALSINA